MHVILNLNDLNAWFLISLKCLDWSIDCYTSMKFFKYCYLESWYGLTEMNLEHVTKVVGKFGSVLDLSGGVV